MLVISATSYNRSRLATVLAAVITYKSDLDEQAGNTPPVTLNEVDRGLRRVLDL